MSETRGEGHPDDAAFLLAESLMPLLNPSSCPGPPTRHAEGSPSPRTLRGGEQHGRYDEGKGYARWSDCRMGWTEMEGSEKVK